MFFANILSPRCESVHGAGPLRHHSTFYPIAASKALLDGIRKALAIIAMMVLLAGSAQAEENPRSIGEHRVRSGDVSLWVMLPDNGHAGAEVRRALRRTTVRNRPRNHGQNLTPAWVKE